MRKNFKSVAIVATLLIAAAGVVLFEACNKKNEAVKNIPELNAQELTDFDKEMILFGEKMKSASKGNETMPLEEAVGNFCNYQNFKMCDASHYSTEMVSYKIESVIPINNGNVYLSDLYELFVSNKQAIKEKKMSLEGDDKTVYCIISKIDESYKDGDNVRIVTEAFMYGRYLPISNLVDINNTDYWHPCYGCGKCGPYEGQCIGQDAGTRLQQVAQTQIVNVGCLPGYRLVLSDYESKYIYAAAWPDTNSPNGHYGLIHGLYESDCLSPDDMRYYRDNILSKLDEWSTEQALYDRILVMVQYWCFYNSLLETEYAHAECSYVGLDD